MASEYPALSAIGRTPLLQLRRILPRGSGRVLVKLESANPTGSMKDRVAKAMVEAALQDGRLKPGGIVVEYTGGTTGVSLAYVCAVFNLRSHFVSSDAFSEEKLRMIRAFGGELTLIPSDGRRVTRELIQAMIAKAQSLSQQPGHWLCDQLNNCDGEASVASEVQSATTDESSQMARRLAREEAMFTGTSSGLNVIAALRVAARLGPNSTVATLAIDSELRYLSTDVLEP